MPADVISVVARNKELAAIKQFWLDLLQLVGQYVDTRRMDFTTTQMPGDFLNRDVFDSVAPKAAKTCASAILSAIWPQSPTRFRFIPPRNLKETSATKEYYEEITRRQMAVMDDPEGGLQLALDEYMKDDVTFGTAGVEIMPDKKTKVKARAWGVKNLKVAEGSDNRVDTIYIELEKPVHWFVKEYGVKNLSPKLQGLFKNRKFEEKAHLLIAIEPRIMRDVTKKGAKSMAFQSCHIELDTNHLIREKGFAELPIKVGRFSKLLGEEYGRCPAMDALPDLLEANMVWEATTIAIEKILDPPLGVLDDGKLGGSEVDTSAGALTVFNISGRAGEKNPIFPLFTVGDPQWAIKLIEQLGKTISDHFYLDRLLDFNNETRMTLGEANLRNKLRNSTLGSIFTRQIQEVVSPTVNRYFNILLEQGEFGYPANRVPKDQPDALIIPDEVVKLMASGKNVYEIEYFTPAMRIMQAEEADGIIRAWEFAGLVAGSVPQAVDGLDEDVSIRLYANKVGAPSEIRRAQTDMDKIRTARLATANAAQQAEQIKSGAEAIRNLGQSGMVPTQQPAGTSGKK